MLRRGFVCKRFRMATPKTSRRRQAAPTLGAAPQAPEDPARLIGIIASTPDAIVTADARMVHAHDGAAVAEVAIAPWWRRRIAYAFRFPGV